MTVPSSESQVHEDTKKPLRPPNRGVVGAFAIGLAPLIPGLRHNFYLDDFRWLEHAYYASRDIGHLFTQWLPGFIRPIGQAVFFLEFLAFRFQALPYNIASLLLHAIVGSMVWRLCRRIGIGATGRSIAAAMFLIGAGHFTKAVHWACSIPILCGTALLLWTVTTIAPHSHSASRSSSPANGASSAVRGFRLAILTLAGVALPFTHDLFALAPLGLAAVVVAVGHRQRRLLGSIWMTAGLAYVVGTLSAHADVTQPHKIGWNALANAFHSFACLVAPLGNAGILRAQLIRLGNLPDGTAAAIILTVGAVLAAYLIAFAVRSRARSVAGCMLLALLVLAPSIVVDYRVRWIDVRYLYPFAALMIPVLIAAGSTWLPTSSRRKRRALVIGTVVVCWYLSILPGTLSMVTQALAEGADPKSETRWERLELIRSGVDVP